jgi:hypothetical protein
MLDACEAGFSLITRTIRSEYIQIIAILKLFLISRLLSQNYVGPRFHRDIATCRKPCQP